MAESYPTAGDELLRWVSEAGSGTWPQLRDACAYVAQKYGLTAAPLILASDLSALGHIDIEWKTRSWSVALPALNLVPGLGLCLVLTGSRPYYLDQRFEEVTDEVDVYPFGISSRRSQRPGSLSAPASRSPRSSPTDLARH